MLYQLTPDKYEYARPLFTDWRPYLIIFAVINGDCPGTVYVDDRRHPETAFLWDHDEGEFYLAGRADNTAFNRALNACIRNQIRSHAQAHLAHLSEYTFYCDTDAWAPEIDTVLAGLNPMAHRRKLYVLDHATEHQQVALPDGFKLARVVEQTFERQLHGIDIMREWVLRPWRTAADVARREIGYCITHGDNLVGWYVSEYTCQPFPGEGTECQVGIYTCEEYRRRGSATLVARATVEDCWANGIERIGWHCWEANMASAATAERVGFELVIDRPVYNGCFNQFDNLLLQAHYHAQADRLEAAIARWEEAFALWEADDSEALTSPHCRAHPDTVGWCYFAAGRTRAQWGEQEVAFRHLNKAIDNGWRDSQRLLEDERFHGLCDTPEWRALLARFQPGRDARPRD